jgi:adenylate kinase family enzyme
VSFFIIIRGPLGAGKTTIALSLAHEVGAEVVSIDSILESWEWDGGSESLFLKANVVGAQKGRAILERETPVIFDGNFYWRSVIEDLVARLPFDHRIFTLTVPLEVCIERDKARSLSYGEEGARAVFAKVTSFNYGISIDAIGDVTSVVSAIRAQLP